MMRRYLPKTVTTADGGLRHRSKAAQEEPENDDDEDQDRHSHGIPRGWPRTRVSSEAPL